MNLKKCQIHSASKTRHKLVQIRKMKIVISSKSSFMVAVKIFNGLSHDMKNVS